MLLRTFSRIASKTGSTFPEVLYLTHRAGLLPSFAVKQAGGEHLEDVRALLTTFSGRKEIYESFTDAMDDETALVAVCEGQVVGFAVLSLEVDLQLLGTNFELEVTLRLLAAPSLPVFFSLRVSLSL